MCDIPFEWAILFSLRQRGLVRKAALRKRRVIWHSHGGQRLKNHLLRIDGYGPAGPHDCCGDLAEISALIDCKESGTGAASARGATTRGSDVEGDRADWRSMLLKQGIWQ